MKSNRNIGVVCLLAGVFIASAPYLISSTKVGEYESVRAEVPQATVPPAVPSQISFAGQSYDLSRYDLRERMDRELMSFTYMHSSTLLMLKRANRFFPVIEPILKESRIPDDFKYLMVIESNINTQARSSAGAAGLWQFMQTTGREHGLEVNANVDERYNVEKATRAACKYLNDAYRTYGDWMKVAASYNAGKGRISGELRKQQASDAMDLWLVEETSRYMFRIVAAKMVFQDPQRYGFYLKKEQLYPPMRYKEEVVTTPITDLATFAIEKGVTYAQLKDANPWLRSSSLENKSGKRYVLLIPQRGAMYYDPKGVVPHSKSWVVD